MEDTLRLLAIRRSLKMLKQMPIQKQLSGNREDLAHATNAFHFAGAHVRYIGICIFCCLARHPNSVVSYDSIFSQMEFYRNEQNQAYMKQPWNAAKHFKEAMRANDIPLFIKPHFGIGYALVFDPADFNDSRYWLLAPLLKIRNL